MLGIALALLERETHVHRLGPRIALGQVRTAVARQLALPAKICQLKAQRLLFQRWILQMQRCRIHGLCAGLGQRGGKTCVVEGRRVAPAGRVHQTVLDRMRLALAHAPAPVQKALRIHPYRRAGLAVDQGVVAVGQPDRRGVLRRCGLGRLRRCVRQRWQHRNA